MSYTQTKLINDAKESNEGLPRSNPTEIKNTIRGVFYLMDHFQRFYHENIMFIKIALDAGVPCEKGALVSLFELYHHGPLKQTGTWNQGYWFFIDTLQEFLHLEDDEYGPACADLASDAQVFLNDVTMKELCCADLHDHANLFPYTADMIEKYNGSNNCAKRFKKNDRICKM